MSKCKHAVMQLLSQAPEGLTLHDLAENTGYTYKSVEAACTEPPIVRTSEMRTFGTMGPPSAVYVLSTAQHRAHEPNPSIPKRPAKPKRQQKTGIDAIVDNHQFLAKGIGALQRMGRTEEAKQMMKIWIAVDEQVKQIFERWHQ